jgi:hypothetical protein
MTKYVTTILKVAVHRESENPIFGEGNTYVGIDDEAGGPFLTIEQDSDNDNAAGAVLLRVDYKEFIVIVEAAKMLMHQLYIEKASAESDFNINSANEMDNE